MRFNPFHSGNQQGLVKATASSRCQATPNCNIISLYPHKNYQYNISYKTVHKKTSLAAFHHRDFPTEVDWLLDLSDELRRSKGLQMGPGQGFNPLKYQSQNMVGKSFANGGLNGRKTWPTTYMWVINGEFRTEFNDFQKQSLHPSLILTDSHLFVDSSLGPVSS